MTSVLTREEQAHPDNTLGGVLGYKEGIMQTNGHIHIWGGWMMRRHLWGAGQCRCPLLCLFRIPFERVLYTVHMFCIPFICFVYRSNAFCIPFVCFVYCSYVLYTVRTRFVYRSYCVFFVVVSVVCLFVLCPLCPLCSHAGGWRPSAPVRSEVAWIPEKLLSKRFHLQAFTSSGREKEKRDASPQKQSCGVRVGGEG